MLHPNSLRLEIGVQPTLEPKLVALIRVSRDELEAVKPELYRRWIVGTIEMRGSAWEQFEGSLSGEVCYMEDKVGYVRINNLHINGVHNPEWALAHVDGNTIHLVLLEQFDGTIEELRAAITHAESQSNASSSKWSN